MAKGMTDPNTIVGDLYEAALDDEKWMPLMASVERLFGGHASALNVIGPIGPRLLSSHMDPETEQLYNERFWTQDPWLGTGKTMKAGDLTTGATILPRSEIGSAFRHHMLDPNDIEDLMAVKSQLAPDWEAYLLIYRSREAGLFTRTDMARMKALSGHIERAVRVRETLATQTRLAWELDAVLYRLPVGAVLVDEVLRICWSNRLADRLLLHEARRPGRGNRFPLGTDEEESALQTAVLQAIHVSRGGDIVITGTKSRRPLRIEILPLNDRFYEERISSWIPAGQRRRCLLLIHETAPVRSAPVG